MAPSREIEKLQRRWQENPLGLTFAPLAEAYRKEGMLAEALELLEIGLTQHPSYVPAHIVKGRCHLDARVDPDAERAFLRVADLDPENVIALKGLAEIAERSGRFDEAIQRLERLLEFDRSNDDALQQLDQLRAARRGPEPVATPEPDRAPAPIELPRADIIDRARNDLEVVIFSPVELTANPTTEFQEAGHAESLEATSARGNIGAGFEPPTAVDAVFSVEAEAPAAAPEPPEPESVEPAPSRAELAELEPARPEPAEPTRPEPESVEPELPDPESAEPALVVTETMAEVFLRQGHRELALAVYGQLASRDPDNARIGAAIERLQAEVGRHQSSVIPAYAAVLTGGQSVRGYFEHLLAARRPGNQPRGEELSLGSIFGDERVGTTASAPTGPDPSFDEFYADTSDAAPVSPTEPPAADEPGADDLEGFSDWLRGLRR